MADEGDSKSLVLITRVGSTPTTGIKNGSKLTWSYFCNAPSPSGKAGDFDSPIVGSTPAGATENRLNGSGLELFRRFLSYLFVI